MKLTESYLVSNRKIKNALGIEKMPVTATEGINTLYLLLESRGYTVCNVILKNQCNPVSSIDKLIFYSQHED